MSTTITVYAPGGIAYLSLNDRHHWRLRAQRVREWRRAGYIAALALGPQPPAVLSFVFEVPDKRRRDPMNAYATVKALVDGMATDAGCWADDTPEFITTVEPVYRVVTGARFRRRVDITITPRGAA